MLMMENAEEVQQALERFTKLKQTQIPSELEDYLCFVAKSGDTIFRWAVIKALFREKLIAVIKQFHEQTAIDDLPHYPNVDPFNYETMKTALLERLDSFSAAPFTVQRICELLTDPRKQYSRIDKFMRAIEKNILVVSTTEPGRPKSLADSSDYSDSLDSMVNGSSNVTGGAASLADDLAGDIDVDIELENGTATIAVGAATPGALPSINTLNSAILAATTQPPATPDDLLAHHGAPLNEEEDDDDDDDDEDVVHNHLATEEAVESSSGTDPVAVAVAATSGDDNNKSLGKKRAEEEEKEEEDVVKRAKLEVEEEKNEKKEEEKKTQETIPEKDNKPVEKGEEKVVSDASAPSAAAATETCEKEEIEEAKDLQKEPVTPAAGDGEAVETKKEEQQETPVVKEQQVDAEVATEAVEESEKKADDVPPSEITSDVVVAVVVPPAEPIVADVAVEECAEKESLSPEAMEAEPVASSGPTAIAASDMDVDSSEGTVTAGAAIVAGEEEESSVSMDEPMEDQ